MKTRGRGYLKVFRRPYTENKAKRQEPELGRTQHTRKQGRRQTRSTSNPERATKKKRENARGAPRADPNHQSAFPSDRFLGRCPFFFRHRMLFAPSFEDGVEYFLRPLGSFCWASSGAHVENVWSPLVHLGLVWGPCGARLGSSCPRHRVWGVHVGLVWARVEHVWIQL